MQEVTVTAKRIPKQCPAAGLAGPLTNLLGFAWAVDSFVAGTIMGTNPQVLPAPNGIRVTNSPLNIGGRAVTLGNFEIFTPNQAPQDFGKSAYSGAIVNVGRHEDGHTYQAVITGDGYLLAIGAGALLFGDKSPLELLADGYAVDTGC
jgi:hypothetical protein